MVLACVASLWEAVPALASGPANDAAATRAYVRASEAYARGASTEVGGGVAAIADRASEIAGECPSALTYAPRDAAFGDIGDEASTALFYSDVAPMSATRLGFAHAVGGLRWRDRRLTRLVHAQAVEEVAEVALALPNVCADIEAWKASAYATLPQSATGFLARVAAIESGSYFGPSEEPREALINRLLKPYEGSRELRTMERIKQHDQRAYRMLGEAEEAAQSKLAAALGVSTL